MLRRPFPDATLEALRTIGDPRLADQRIGDIGSYFSDVAVSGLDVALANSGVRDIVMVEAQHDFDEALAMLESFGIEPTQAIARGRGLFTKYGDEISAALLLAGLPNSYATEWGARVLVAHGDLVWALPRRVRQTAMFLMTVLTADETAATAKDPAATATIVRTAAGLRLFHHVLRTKLQDDDRVLDALGAENSTPINQEDLLGTLLTFTITTFGVLDQLGVELSKDDRDAYLLFWDLIGAALGIGTASVRTELKARTETYAPDPLRPQTLDAATQLLDQLHTRQWLPDQTTINDGRPFPWSGLVPGRMLANALLAALSDAMPAPKRTWPAVVMRELAPTLVRSRLGLDRTGMTAYATRRIADRSRYVKIARAGTLRMMANDITRHAMESFLRADGPPFQIPGLDLRELTKTSAGQSQLVDANAHERESDLKEPTQSG